MKVLCCFEASLKHKEVIQQTHSPYILQHSHFLIAIKDKPVAALTAHIVCTYICMSKPMLLHSLLCSDRMSVGIVRALQLSLPLRLCVASLHSNTPVLQQDRLGRKGWLIAYFLRAAPCSFSFDLCITFFLTTQSLFSE